LRDADPAEIISRKEMGWENKAILEWRIGEQPRSTGRQAAAQPRGLFRFGEAGLAANERLQKSRNILESILILE
jgi:hypothetical protein